MSDFTADVTRLLQAVKHLTSCSIYDLTCQVRFCSCDIEARRGALVAKAIQAWFVLAAGTNDYEFGPQTEAKARQLAEVLETYHGPFPEGPRCGFVPDIGQRAIPCSLTSGHDGPHSFEEPSLPREPSEAAIEAAGMAQHEALPSGVIRAMLRAAYAVDFPDKGKR